MQRPSFGVVTGVVAVLAAIAFVSKLVIELIPSGPENSLGTERAEFLKQASHHQIEWHLLSEETFAEARRRDKPIMLVVGSACSPTGRFSDKVVFITKEIRGFLARNFVCARADSMAQPDLMNAFLPVSRAVMDANGRLAIPPDYQVWFLDPKGNLFGYTAEMVNGQPLSGPKFLADLAEAADRYERIRDGEAHAGQEQLRDFTALRGPIPQRLPELSKFADFLRDSSPADVGGFPVNGFQRTLPSAWRFQLLAGRYEEYGRSIVPYLTSPQVDLLDGGFFTDVSSMDWRGGGYDKLAVTNAGLMQILALGSVLMRDPEQRWLALRTFDSLAEEFTLDGLILAGRIGDEGTLGRSDRCSFSPRKLRELFPDDADREWIRQNLGLRVETNPQMTPMLAKLNLPLADTDRFERIMGVLRKDRPAAKFAGRGYLDVGGFAVARMLQAARILGDDARRLKAEGLFERLDSFRSMNDVTHDTVSDRPYAYLGDYLAYADGALQYFLATGDSEALANGAAVLRRGLFLFGWQTKGVYGLTQAVPEPPNADSPEIVDNLRESCTAQTIRLCNDYGRLLGSQGKDLTQAASDTLSRFVLIAPALGQFVSGYFCAAVEMQDSAFALVVGPDGVKTASELSRLAPTRLVAPVAPGMRTPGAAPGIYVIADHIVTGPMSIEKAAEALRRSSF